MRQPSRERRKERRRERAGGKLRNGLTRGLLSVHHRDESTLSRFSSSFIAYAVDALLAGIKCSIRIILC